MAELAAKAVDAMDEADAYELLYHMKHFCETKPEEAAQLLNEHVEFARALAQMQLRLGMYDPKAAETNARQSNQAQRSMELQLDPEQQELLEQVQNLAPEIIQALPYDQRKQIMELREAMGLPPV